MGLGCVGEDDRDFVGGWDGVGRSWVSLMVSHTSMLMEEDGWGRAAAKNRVRMCVWGDRDEGGSERRRDSGRIAWGRRKGYSSNI